MDVPISAPLNPKHAAGAKKAPVHLVPPITVYGQALAFADGAGKYGPYNWRVGGAEASVYYAAAMRHMLSWWEGQDLSPDAQVDHLAHVQACLTILMDTLALGILKDDRPPAGPLPALLEAYAQRDAPPKLADLLAPTAMDPVTAHQLSELVLPQREASPVLVNQPGDKF